MAADCYLCIHAEKLTEDFKNGDRTPVGDCDVCSVLACDKHGERGTDNRFICYLCIPVQVDAVGPGTTTERWPTFTEKALSVAPLTAQQFRGMTPHDASMQISRVVLAQIARER